MIDWLKILLYLQMDWKIVKIQNAVIQKDVLEVNTVIHLSQIQNQ